MDTIETTYLKGEDIARAREAGGAFAGIDVNGTNYVIPVGFMEANGVRVSILRELSHQRPDGSMAQAGESYHYALQFERMSDNTILERAIPYLPGCQSCKVWDQDDIDAACARAINRWRIEVKRLGEREIERQRVEAQRQKQREVRQKTVEAYAETKKIAIEKTRIRSRVATLDDGKVWTVGAHTPFASVLIPYPNSQDAQRILALGTEVLPITHQSELEIRRMIGSLTQRR